MSIQGKTLQEWKTLLEAKAEALEPFEYDDDMGYIGETIWVIEDYTQKIKDLMNANLQELLEIEP